MLSQRLQQFCLPVKGEEDSADELPPITISVPDEASVPSQRLFHSYADQADTHGALHGFAQHRQSCREVHILSAKKSQLSRSGFIKTNPFFHYLLVSSFHSSTMVKEAQKRQSNGCHPKCAWWGRWWAQIESLWTNPKECNPLLQVELCRIRRSAAVETPPPRAFLEFAPTATRPRRLYGEAALMVPRYPSYPSKSCNLPWSSVLKSAPLMMQVALQCMWNKANES